MKKKKENEKLLIYGMYCNYIDEIQHFDNIQTYFRILSSTILIGSIAAVGFLFSLENFNLPLTRTIAFIFILIMSVFALLAFWRIDLNFYEKLLASNFAEAYKLEQKVNWLPKIHHNMLYGVHHKDHPSNVAYYYIGCCLTIILTTGIAISYDFYKNHDSIILGILSIFIMILMLVWIFIFIKMKTKKIIDFMNELNLK